MRIDVVSIFPEYLAPLELSLIGKARRTGLLDLRVHDLRDFTHDRHRTVDDAPAGGGAGMVMRPEPWAEAFDALLAGAGTAESGAGEGVAAEAGDGRGAGGGVAAGSGAEAGVGGGAGGESGAMAGGGVSTSPLLLVPSPSGERFTQAMARELAGEPWLAFACGRYEGIDERVYEDAATRMRVRPVSLGDYVLNGGEVAVLAVVEAVARLLPGVIGNAESLVEESHEDGLLEYPVYTRPTNWNGREIPEVLNSGHHARIARWRRDQQLMRTAERRPDLVAALDPAALDRADLALLASVGWVPEGPRFRLVAAPVAD